MRFHLSVLLVAATAVALPATGVAGDAGTIEVTQCGQRIPRGATAVLTGDLACSNDFGVVLRQGATLDLQGFTLSGAQVGVACMPAYCEVPACYEPSRCEVRNGTVTETRTAIGGGRVTVRNLMVDGYGGAGVNGWARVQVFNSFFVNATQGISARRVELTGSRLINTFVNAERTRLTSSSVTNNDRFGVTPGALR